MHPCLHACQLTHASHLPAALASFVACPPDSTLPIGAALLPQSHQVVILADPDGHEVRPSSAAACCAQPSVQRSAPAHARWHTCSAGRCTFVSLRTDARPARLPTLPCLPDLLCWRRGLPPAQRARRQRAHAAAARHQPRRQQRVGSRQAAGPGVAHRGGSCGGAQGARRGGTGGGGCQSCRRIATRSSGGAWGGGGGQAGFASCACCSTACCQASRQVSILGPAL